MARTDVTPSHNCPGNGGGDHEALDLPSAWDQTATDEQPNHMETGICIHCGALFAVKVEITPED